VLSLLRLRNFRAIATSSVVSGPCEAPNMFRSPAYDPVAIAVMGFGIALAAAVAFAF
jgi:hypothetical protein